MLGFVFFSDLFYFSFGMLASKKFLRAPRSFERKTSLRAEGSADSCRVSRSCSLLAAGFASLQGLAERGSAVLRGLQSPLLCKSRNGLCGPSGLAGSLALEVLERALRSFGACRVPCFASLEAGSAVLWGLQGPLLCKSWNGLCGPLGLAGSLALQVLERSEADFEAFESSNEAFEAFECFEGGLTGFEGSFEEGGFEGFEGPFVLALEGFEAFEAFESEGSKALKGGRLRRVRTKASKVRTKASKASKGEDEGGFKGFEGRMKGGRLRRVRTKASKASKVRTKASKGEDERG